MPHRYRIYGLVVDVPFHCPSMIELSSDTNVDISVTEGPVPTPDGPLPDFLPAFNVIDGRSVMIGGPWSGNFLIADNNSVVFDRGPQANEHGIGYHFVRGIMPILVRAREQLTLHASCVATPGGAVMVTGLSGAGKSTTVTALIQRGCTLLSDDLTVLKRQSDGEIVVMPGASQLFLCSDAAANLGGEDDQILDAPYTRMKSMLLCPSDEEVQPSPLRSICVLSNSEGCDSVRKTQIEGAAKFGALMRCVTGRQTGFTLDAPRFSLAAAIAASTTVYSVERPAGRWCIDEVADVVLEECRRHDPSQSGILQ